MPNETTFVVSSSPHIRATENTRSIMLDVCVALSFTLLISVYSFGWRALTLTALSVVSCVFFEWAYRKLMKKDSSIGDLSAVVTGMLLSFGLSVTVPYWMVIVGAFFAIVIVKQLFGGLGHNFMNPALAARVFLFSFPAFMNVFPNTNPGAMTEWPVWGNLPADTLDAISSATPLSLTFMKNGVLPASEQFSPLEMLIGQMPGTLGEVSTLMLLLGGLYLVTRRVLSPRIPLYYLGTVAVLTYLFPQGGNNNLDWMLYQLLSGGLVLGAVFMATDYATTPVTKRGRTLFAIGCGALTVLIRYFGAYPEGVSFAILIMNSTTWLLDKYGLPRRFGTPRLAFLRKGDKPS